MRTIDLNRESRIANRESPLPPPPAVPLRISECDSKHAGLRSGQFEFPKSMRTSAPPAGAGAMAESRNVKSEKSGFPVYRPQALGPAPGVISVISEKPKRTVPPWLFVCKLFPRARRRAHGAPVLASSASLMTLPFPRPEGFHRWLSVLGGAVLFPS